MSSRRNWGDPDPRRKLTDDQARGILALRPDPIRAGKLSKDLAKTYGVSETLIVRIWRRRAYPHVKVEREQA